MDYNIKELSLHVERILQHKTYANVCSEANNELCYSVTKA